MAGSITVDVLSDGSKRYRSRYRDARGRQHEKRFMRKVDAQRWLDEQTSAIVTQTWTAPERGRVTVDVWAEQWLAAQTGLKASTLYRYRSLLRVQILPRWGRHRLAESPMPRSPRGWPNSSPAASRRRRCGRRTASSHSS
jgi:hypothetical protein